MSLRILRSTVLLFSLLLSFAASAQDSVRYKVLDRAVATIDKKLFGQFLERPSWQGETGIEAAVIPGTRKLQPEVEGLLKGLHIPILRFPGGTDVDYTDWRDMVDLPGRPYRPITIGYTGATVTNNFGYAEFLDLCRTLRTEPLLVVNFRDGLFRIKPLPLAARHAADLLRWVKQKRTVPVRYWQIGNETWGFMPELERQHGAKAAQWYVDCLAAYIDALRQVDPSIEIIVDGHSPEINRLIKEQLGAKVNYLVDHVYAPWNIRAFTLEGKDVPTEGLTQEEVWNAWVSVSEMDGAGLSVMNRPLLAQAKDLGYPVAITEWNFNGWWNPGVPGPLDSDLARGLGATGYLHAMMRAGDRVKIGCQSMTVGRHWGITAIRVDETTVNPPHYLPTGQILGLYARHHGDRLLQISADALPTFAQPYKFNQGEPRSKVASLDTLVTASRDKLYLHIMNRSFSRSATATFDLAGLGGLKREAVQHLFTGRLENRRKSGEPLQVGLVSERRLPLKGETIEVMAPARSVSVVVIDRSP
jgi:alpha-L-arabinofuranosidase